VPWDCKVRDKPEASRGKAMVHSVAGESFTTRGPLALALLTPHSWSTRRNQGTAPSLANDTLCLQIIQTASLVYEIVANSWPSYLCTPGPTP
jgi:hypothetical protein